MKKKILTAFGVAFFGFASITSSHADAPCPTGFSIVSTSWWPPSNNTWYTMCGCISVKGKSASGSCSGGGVGGGDQQ